MAKEGWQKGEGPYSKTSDIRLTQKPMVKDREGRKDISKVVDENSERNGGFPAKLTPSKD
jgi:hypothetical protein